MTTYQNVQGKNEGFEQDKQTYLAGKQPHP